MKRLFTSILALTTIGLLAVCVQASQESNRSSMSAGDERAGELYGIGDHRVLNPEMTELEMRPRPKDEADFPKYIDYLVSVAEPRTPEERAKDTELMKKYTDVIVMDSLFVGGPGFPAGFTNEQ